MAESKNNPQTRNAKAEYSRRLNDDWQYLDEGEESANPTTDEAFNRGYRYRGIGRQSSVKDKTDEPTIPKSRNHNEVFVDQKTLSDPKFQQEIKKAEKQINQQTRNAAIQRAQEEEIENDRPQQIKKTVKTKKASKEDRLKAFAINRLLLFVFIPLFLIQLTVGLFGIVTLGVAEGLYQTTKAVADANWFTKTIATVIETVHDGVEWLTGLNLADVTVGAVSGVFIATYMVVLTFGFIQIFIAWLAHSINGNETISGGRSSQKFSALLVCILGYCLPIINVFFPWIFIWTFTIGKYPK